MFQEKLGLFLTVPKQQVCCFLAFAISPSPQLEINNQRQKLSRPQNSINFSKVCFIFQRRVKIGITWFGPRAVSFQDNMLCELLADYDSADYVLLIMIMLC